MHEWYECVGDWNQVSVSNCDLSFSFSPNSLYHILETLTIEAFFHTNWANSAACSAKNFHLVLLYSPKDHKIHYRLSHTFPGFISVIFKFSFKNLGCDHYEMFHCLIYHKFIDCIAIIYHLVILANIVENKSSSRQWLYQHYLGYPTENAWFQDAAITNRTHKVVVAVLVSFPSSNFVSTFAKCNHNRECTDIPHLRRSCFHNNYCRSNCLLE